MSRCGSRPSCGASGVRVEVYPEPDKLGKQFKYAAAKAIPFAAILGGDEIARGEVTIKNLKTGEQQSVPRASVVSWLRKEGPSDGRVTVAVAVRLVAEARQP